MVIIIQINLNHNRKLDSQPLPIKTNIKDQLTDAPLRQHNRTESFIATNYPQII